MAIIMAAQMLLSLFVGAVIGSMEAMLPGGSIAAIAMLVPFLPLGSTRSRFVAVALVSASISLLFVVFDWLLRGKPQPIASPHAAVPPTSPSLAIATPSWVYDLLESAGARRRACMQKALFAGMGTNVLFVAAGTGLNFANFPPGRDILAIDINPDMLSRAESRKQAYDGSLRLFQADVQNLPFEDERFDTVATSSTFCSVPDAVRGLAELYRVLRPGGDLLMFEHVRSRNGLIAIQQDLLNKCIRYLGPNINRDTVNAVQHVGFELDRVSCAYLDVFLAIEAHKPGRIST
jgi:SAM-dependent methyltransferase